MEQNDQENMNPCPSHDSSDLTSALAQLRLKLLDLSGRNRLLNYKHSIGRSLPFVEGQPTDVYQRLVESNNRPYVTILGLPEPSRRDWFERNGRLARPDPKEWARLNQIPTSHDLPEPSGNSDDSHVRTLLYQDDLAKHCRKIDREATLAIEETGANMLFLVLGFLEYPDQRDSDRIFSSPLISVPVSMIKREAGGTQLFSLQYTGDDIAENLSLREKLKIDYNIILPDLPEEGIDVEGYFAASRDIIKTHPGFVLRRRISLCLLSFTNMLLVRDLDPSKWPNIGKKNGLLDHPLVKEVFAGCASTGEGGIGIANEHPVEDGPGARIPLVFDADSSQHSALIDVLLERKNLVIEGPPGTGKSQTITNLIAACISEGKKVLFVAEKLAALEVVKDRLTMAGLDVFALELHSNKTHKKRILEELARRVGFHPDPPADLPRKMQQLEAHRGDLKMYADSINSIAHNSLGLTLHKVIWRAEKHRLSLSAQEGFLSQITIGDSSEISEYELYRRMECLGHLGAQYVEIGGFDTDCTYWGFFPEQIIPGDDFKLGRFFSSTREWAEPFIHDVRIFCDHLDMKDIGLSINDSKMQLESLRAFMASIDESQPLYLIPAFFIIDGTGNRAKRLLQAMAVKLERFHELAPVVQTALHSEFSVNQPRLESLRQVAFIAGKLGVTLGITHEISNLIDTLQREHDRLAGALAAIVEFCKEKRIPFDGSRGNLTRLAALANLVAEIPEELLHFQRPGLTREDCIQCLESLSNLQREWTGLHKELDGVFYIDTLPAEGSIKQAILTLREGDAWYRIFQSRWRSAIGLHRSLQRTKQRLSSGARLTQLEKIVTLLNLKDRWKTDPAWVQYLGFPAPAEAPSLEGYIALAVWNRSAKLLLEDFQTQVMTPIDLTPEKARALRREFAPFGINVSTAITALQAMDSLLPRLSEERGCETVEKCLGAVALFVENLVAQLEWLQQEVHGQAPFKECLAGCEAALERRGIVSSIDDDHDIKGLLGDHFNGLDTDVQSAMAALSCGERIEGLNLGSQIKTKLRSADLINAGNSLISTLEKIHGYFEQVADFQKHLCTFGEFDLATWTDARPESGLSKFSKALNSQLEAAEGDVGSLIPWANYIARRNEAGLLGLGEFVSLIETRQVPPGELADAYAYCTYATIVREAFRRIPQLGKFAGLKHNQIRDEFKKLDKEIIELRGKSIAGVSHVSAHTPSGRNGPRVDHKTEMVLLNYLIPQQRPRMPVRKMMTRAGRAIQALKPCFMMGPQAVAQYLEPGNIKFDLIIMDEASQLKPEEAIGSIARGGQLVVVGDSKQLPPTTFFTRMSQVTDDDDQFTTTDAESILDVCSAHFRPPRTLRWHYRSQHHSLIAFSNHSFYRNNLIIFPSPYGQSSRLGVRATYLADAIYDNQTNLREAKRVVDAVADHIIHRPEESLGVVTLNIKQRDLIAELLEERLRAVPGVDAYRETWAKAIMPLFVKNLETVQGDERDAIIISTTFGRPPGANAVRQNFGPISRQGGWRRLNVLFTRARKSISVYTSLRPEDIVIDGTTPEGTKALRNYLEYARTGLLPATAETGIEPESDFEIAVINVLRSRGYDVTPQLGVAGYRIDIAVKHPDSHGGYLAAIECDGASYHSALSVRDRDRIRQEVLESLGWRGRIWRIWSTDWFRAPTHEIQKLISFLEDLRKNWKPQHPSGESWVEEGVQTPMGTTQEQESEEREVVSQVLIEADDDLEVEVGDIIKYVNIDTPDDVLTICITSGVTDTNNGLISKATPLAQTLLGAVVGDEVTLHIPGKSEKTFCIREIKRPGR